MDHNSGVYQIINKVNGHRYIGSAIYLDGREYDHFVMLKNGGGSNIILQRACAKYGIDNLEFIILLYCTPEHCIMYEQMVMDKFKPEYNICKIAGSRLGVPHSEETRRKMLGNTNSLGYKHSEETKRKMSESLRGNTNSLGYMHSEATKKKMSIAQHGNANSFGYKHSEESKQKIGDANRGNTHLLGHKHSEETKRKMSEARKGRTSPMKGRKLSDDHKRKISESHKRRIVNII